MCESSLMLLLNLKVIFREIPTSGIVHRNSVFKFPPLYINQLSPPQTRAMKLKTNLATTEIERGKIPAWYVLRKTALQTHEFERPANFDAQPHLIYCFPNPLSKIQPADSRKELNSFAIDLLALIYWLTDRPFYSLPTQLSHPVPHKISFRRLFIIFIIAVYGRRR